MPYLGNISANRFASTPATKRFNGDDSTTSFTLDTAASADQEILVSVDGVIQDSANYTVTGTTLDFGSGNAPSSGTGNIFVNYIARPIATVGHPSTSNLQAATGTFTSTLGVTGATTLSSTLAVTGAATLSGDLSVSGAISGVSTALSDNDVNGNTTATFTVPTTAKIIYVHWDGVSHSSGSNHNMLVQIGDSGGVETSGYNSNVAITGNTSDTSSNATSAAGFIVYYQAAASDVLNGQTTIVNGGGNRFTMSSIIKSGNYNNVAAGTKTLSAAITTVKISFVSTPTFDAGTVSVTYVE